MWVSDTIAQEIAWSDEDMFPIFEDESYVPEDEGFYSDEQDDDYSPEDHWNATAEDAYLEAYWESRWE